MNKQRRLANLLLQPLVQLRIGMANVVLSLIFVVALGAYAYSRFVQFTDVVVTLTQADAEISKLLGDYLTNIGTTAALAGAVFVTLNLAVSVLMTHRLVGPTVAFRRHIGQLLAGDFKVKTTLRKGDAFGEVAADLNKLSEKLATTVQAPVKAEQNH